MTNVKENKKYNKEYIKIILYIVLAVLMEMELPHTGYSIASMIIPPIHFKDSALYLHDTLTLIPLIMATRDISSILKKYSKILIFILLYLHLLT